MRYRTLGAAVANARSRSNAVLSRSFGAARSAAVASSPKRRAQSTVHVWQLMKHYLSAPVFDMAFGVLLHSLAGAALQRLLKSHAALRKPR